MRGGGSMPGVPVGAAEKGCTLTGVAAAGPAVPIDAVCAGAVSSTRLASCEATTGAETGGRLTGGGSAGSGVAADAVCVGTASSASDLVPRRSCTTTPAASAARSVMGTMSVDFIVMGNCRRSYRKTPNHAFRADRNGCSSKKRLDPRRTRARAGVNGRQAGGVKGVRARDEAAVRRRPHKPDVNHQGEDSASLNRCSAVAARVGPGFGSARQHASRSRTCPVGRSWRKRRRRASTAG